MSCVTSVQMLIWTFLLFTANSNLNYDKFILFYGETQTGKSSVINSIFDEHVAQTGDDIDAENDGDSVTFNPTVYGKSFTKDEEYGIPADFTLRVMDTPGNLDNRGLIEDKDILDSIILTLSQYKIRQIDVIFISESLAADSKQLRRNLDKIREIFGENIMQSIVVLGTKVNKAYADPRNAGKRHKAIMRMCNNLGIKYMTYESTKAYHHNGQLKEFMNMIFQSDVKPYEMSQVDEINEQIEQKVQELMKQTPKEEKLIQVEKQVIKYKNVQKQEKYWDRVWGEVGRGERKYVLFGPRKRIEGWIPVQKTRTITIKEPYEDKEMVNEKVEVDHDPEKFRQIATEEHKKKLKLPVKFHHFHAEL